MALPKLKKHNLKTNSRWVQWWW